MQARQEDFRRVGAQLVAVSSSDVADHRGIADRIKATFPILADPEGIAIRAYGLLHPNALLGSDRPVARPAIFLIDARGIIRDRLLTENWRVRVRPDPLLDRLKKLSGRCSPMMSELDVERTRTEQIP